MNGNSMIFRSPKNKSNEVANSNQVPPVPGSDNDVDKGVVAKRKLKKVTDEV